MAEDWKALGRAVVARRVALGFRAREAFAEERQFGSRTLGDIEKARKINYHASTLADLDRALKWVGGSAMAVVNGGEPRPIEDEPASTSVPLRPAWNSMSVAELVDELAEGNRVLGEKVRGMSTERDGG